MTKTLFIIKYFNFYSRKNVEITKQIDCGNNPMRELVQQKIFEKDFSFGNYKAEVKVVKKEIKK